MDNWDFLDEDFKKEVFEDNFTVIIIYDIISNKRRTQLSKLLSAFGFRIQKSAFKCLLTREKYKLLIEKIDRYAKPPDLIRFYILNQNVVTQIYGEKLENENEIYYFFWWKVDDIIKMGSSIWFLIKQNINF